MFRNPNAHVKQISNKYWELLDDVHYQGRWESFLVPKGFHTDFATIPRPIIWLIPTYGVYTPAAILHDYLCVSAASDSPIISRADADGLFRRSLRELGVSGPARWTMWAGVRAGSFMSDAKLKDWFLFLAISIPAIVFLIIPVGIVTVWLFFVWLAELLAVLWSKLTGGSRPSELTKMNT